LVLSTESELSAEMIEFGTAHGFTVNAMTVGDAVRWKAGVMASNSLRS
jgi:homoserine kinase